LLAIRRPGSVVDVRFVVVSIPRFLLYPRKQTSSGVARMSTKFQ
jgi:hypothetical protein